jgi:hypothetical protein
MGEHSQPWETPQFLAVIPTCLPSIQVSIEPVLDPPRDGGMHVVSLVHFHYSFPGC